MNSIAQVIEQLRSTFIQPTEPIPSEPVLPEQFLSDDDALVVTKVGHAYRIEDLKAKKSFTVSKAADGMVYCSCGQGKEQQKCLHKLEVIKEAKKLKKMRVDECIKRKIGANMSAYISILRQIVARYERNGDTKNCTYWYYRGQLQAYKHNVRIVIEA